jgi:TonB family protein
MNPSTAPAAAALLISWSLQAGLLSLVGLLLPALFRLDPPALRLRYWQAVLAASLALPFALAAAGARPAGLFFGDRITVTAGGLLAGLDAAPAGGGWVSPAFLLLVAVTAGAAARLLWLGMGLWTLRSWRRSARELVPASDWVGAAGEVGTSARFLSSPRIDGPVTFGWRDPVIFLPAGFAALPEQERQGIVWHELLHVRRRDWPFALGEELLRSLFWFHPGLRLLLSRIELAREQVIDREVVRRTGARRPYLKALWSLAQPPQPAALPGLPFLNRSHLRARVAQLTQEVSMSRRRAAALTLGFAALLAATAGFAAAAFPVGAETPPAVMRAAEAARPIRTSQTPEAPADPKEPRRIGGDVQRPVKISGDPPVYPESAKAAKEQGVTILESVIDTTGKIDLSRTTVLKSSYPDLDQAALEAVKNWTFQPATLDGEPVTVFYTLTINFQVDSTEEPAEPASPQPPQR